MFKSLFLFVAFAILGLSLKTDNLPKSTLSKKVVKKLTPILKKEFRVKNLTWGNEIYFRVCKKEKEFEVLKMNHKGNPKRLDIYPNSQNVVLNLPGIGHHCFRKECWRMEQSQKRWCFLLTEIELRFGIKKYIMGY